jgi:hypothetical protein
MTEDNKDFDRMQDRQEEADDSKFSTKLSVEEMGKIKMQRCCVFIKDSEDIQMVHGKILGMMTELDSLIVRDLRPGREALQCKQLVPFANVHHICASVDLEKCQQCDEYREMAQEAVVSEVVRGKTGKPGKGSADGNQSGNAAE